MLEQFQSSHRLSLNTISDVYNYVLPLEGLVRQEHGQDAELYPFSELGGERGGWHVAQRQRNHNEGSGFPHSVASRRQPEPWVAGEVLKKNCLK